MEFPRLRLLILMHLVNIITAAFLNTFEVGVLTGGSIFAWRILGRVVGAILLERLDAFGARVRGSLRDASSPGLFLGVGPRDIIQLIWIGARFCLPQPWDEASEQRSQCG